MKIEQSKQQNDLRIQRMQKVNEYVEELKKQTKAQVRTSLKKDDKKYKQLIEDLLVQGLIKLMEAQIYIRCRQCDVKILEAV